MLSSSRLQRLTVCSLYLYGAVFFSILANHELPHTSLWSKLLVRNNSREPEVWGTLLKANYAAAVLVMACEALRAWLSLAFTVCVSTWSYESWDYLTDVILAHMHSKIVLWVAECWNPVYNVCGFTVGCGHEQKHCKMQHLLHVLSSCKVNGFADGFRLISIMCTVVSFCSWPLSP